MSSTREVRVSPVNIEIFQSLVPEAILLNKHMQEKKMLISDSFFAQIKGR